MMPDTPLYEIKNLKHRYGDKFLLDIPGLIIKRKTSIGIIGPNGSGKSTLLRMLAFLEKPIEGGIYYKGERASKNETTLRRDVTFLLQEPYLLKRSVFENVAYGLKVRGKKIKLKEKVHEALRLVGLAPENIAKRQWHELSGGEGQRVALASRIVLNPEVLILDEPTANVDQYSAFLIKEAIGKIHKEYGTSLIVVSHDHVWLNSVVEENLKLYDGSIIEHGLSNLLPGPWNFDNTGLWKKVLPDGQKIYAADPPDINTIAILESSNIMVSTEPPGKISAQNILRGTIARMTAEKEPDKVRLEVDVSGMPLICSVTRHAAETLLLIPGKNVWAVFKASSLHWH